MADYLTRKDVDDYGHDLVDFAQRAAAQALTPHLQHLDQQNAELHQRLARTSRLALDQSVEQAVPNYRDIDRDPAWHDWLRSSDPLSSQPRQFLLNDAIAQGDAPRVIAFFKGFERASQAAPPAPQHRAAASRASTRPSPSGTIYTRAQISKLYDQHRRGAYVGREAEWDRLEFDIIRAGAEGRIAGGVDLHGK